MGSVTPSPLVTPRRSRSLAALVLGALLAVAGGHALWAEGARTFRAQELAAWPTVPGEVIYSGVGRRAPLRQRHLGLWPLGSLEHRAVVRYRYAVGGTPYLSDQISPGSARGYRSAARAREVAARYAAGRAVQVRFDPTRPGTAVLHAGNRVSLWRLGVGGLALLGGLANAWRAWRRLASGAHPEAGGARG